LEPLKPTGTEKAPSQPKDRSELIGSSQRPSPPDRKSQVLLKVDVQGDVGPDDVAEWKEWLSVELVAPSNYMTLTLVVKMSIPLWDFLQDRPAYTFMGHIFDRRRAPKVSHYLRCLSLYRLVTDILAERSQGVQSLRLLQQIGKKRWRRVTWLGRRAGAWRRVEHALFVSGGFPKRTIQLRQSTLEAGWVPRLPTVSLDSWWMNHAELCH
jgi:hypothetical protein